MEALLRELVLTGSSTRDPSGVARVVARLEVALAEAGLATERLDGGPFGPHLAFRGPAATAVPAPIFLIGHTDTVFPPGTFEGFEVAGDEACGPGAFDMKGGLVVLVAGLAAARRAGLLDRVPLAGLLVSDEEVGSPDSQPHLRRLATGARAALCFESGRAGDLVVTRRKGTASVRVTAHGVAAHAGNAHEQGRNAIWALSRFVDLAQRLTDRPRGVTVSVGTFRGGTTKNTVPDRAECEVDLRFLTAADGAALEAALLAAAGAAAREVEGTSLEVARTGWRDPLARTPASAALAAAYGACQRESGLGSGEADLAGGGSDACTTGALGVPSIDGLGPRGRDYHTRQETVDLSSLVPKAQAFVRWLATQDPGPLPRSPRA
ncbi:MAG: M20/M25/M40 family metallo-hydrolase [Anaeromyxobacter sp.]|nr:M20/M25/M40 family metallo-hydrolase [Anaeromyxobacter sp.]MBL0278133.1 M20/M25/M40 family metallo-hydrolase [Anaeromyxobacter sp.]